MACVGLLGVRTRDSRMFGKAGAVLLASAGPGLSRLHNAELISNNVALDSFQSDL